MGVQNKQKLIAKSKASSANKLSCHAFDLFSAHKDLFFSRPVAWHLVLLRLLVLVLRLHDDSTTSSCF